MGKVAEFRGCDHLSIAEITADDNKTGGGSYTTVSFVVSSKPPNIQIFPRLIQAAVSPFEIARLPVNFSSIVAAMPTGMENIQHHFGYGVRPFANALIYAALITKKNIRNNIIAGSRK